jgi:hypothetical protein
MRRLLPAIALTFFLAVSPAAHPAEVSCLDYGDPSQSYAAQARSEKNTDKAPSSNAKPNKNPFDQFDDIPVPCVEGLLRGQIVGGDYENVVRLFRDSHPVLRKFSLISPGGSVEEAIRIGRLFRKYAITARAPFRFFNGSFEAIGPHAATLLCAGSSESVCASACVLIWFGAVDRWGTVGLHRPHADDPAFRAMTPSEASVAYGRMLDSVRKYLDEMEVPKQLIESMVATGSAEIRWADAVEDNVRRPPSIAEWEDASCGSFTDQEDKTMSLLVNKRVSTDLTQSETLLLNLLLEKRTKKNRCETALISSHIERLPPP